MAAEWQVGGRRSEVEVKIIIHPLTNYVLQKQLPVERQTVY